MKSARSTHFTVFLLGGFLAALIPAGGTSGEDKWEEAVSLTQLIQEAQEKNPEVMAARDRWRSAQEIINVQRALPDPQLSYTHFVESVETRLGPQEHIVGVNQKFPFYGKRDLKAEIAGKEAEALGSSYEAVKQEIIRQVKMAFYDLFYVSTLMDITLREKDLLKRFEKIAMIKYETGGGTQQSILKVQVELTRLQDKLLGLSTQRETAAAALNRLLDRPAHLPVGKPAQPHFREFYFIQPELFRLARVNRPELKAAASLIQQSEETRSLARKDYFPDLTIGANYIVVDEGPLDVKDNGKDAYNFMFSINIPIWQSKLSSQVESASQMINSRKSQYEGILNRTLFEVKDYYFKIQTARETYALYNDVLIPQAEQSLKSAEAGYTTGIASFLDLLDAERVLLQIHYGYWKAYTDYLKHIADMERAVGIELEEFPREERMPPSIREE